MAKAQAKSKSHAGRIRRFFGWFGRHKVTAVFTTLVVALVLYLVGSWVVLQVQIHFERKKYEAVNTDIQQLAANIFEYIGTPAAQKHVQSCTYTSVEIGPSTRSCNLEQYFTYPTTNVLNSNDLIAKINSVVRHKYSLSISSNPITEDGNISTYNMNLERNGISCFIDYWSIDNSRTRFVISRLNVNTSSGIFIEISCGGGAKAEYFPAANG